MFWSRSQVNSCILVHVFPSGTLPFSSPGHSSFLKSPSPSSITEFPLPFVFGLVTYDFGISRATSVHVRLRSVLEGITLLHPISNDQTGQ